MPVGFLTREQRDGFGRYVEAPSREELERFFHPSDDDHKAILPLRGEQQPGLSPRNTIAEALLRSADRSEPRRPAFDNFRVLDVERWRAAQHAAYVLHDRHP